MAGEEVKLTEQQEKFCHLLKNYEDLLLKAGMQTARMQLIEGRETGKKINEMQVEILKFVLPHLA